jgi:hypothetical protein
VCLRYKVKVICDEVSVWASIGTTMLQVILQLICIIVLVVHSMVHGKNQIVNNEILKTIGVCFFINVF